MNRMTHWGESMYGGWYADTIMVSEDGREEYGGLHANTQEELREKLKANGIEPILSKNKRWDNI